jgi:SAM-dependent methyltransferase
LDDNSVDYVLVFNLLEHIYNYNFLLKEMFRVLKPGGAMIGSTPFLYKIHPSPNDFFRYSQDALEKIFKDVGFNKISIDYIGYGPFTIQYSQIEFGLPKILRLLFIWTSILLDKIILRLKSKTLSNKFPLGYLFIVKK